jgi:hypothetical protein
VTSGRVKFRHLAVMQCDMWQLSGLINEGVHFPRFKANNYEVDVLMRWHTRLWACLG